MAKKICTDGNLDNSYLFSAEAVVNNEDLIREIFLSLPVRSLIRFKLVSKQWYSLISDSQFARDRTKRLNPNLIAPSGLFFYNSLTESKEIEYVSLDDSPVQHSRVGVRVPSLSFLETAARDAEITILQSCNGLLFFRFTSESEDKYCVCNPTTKDYYIIPQLHMNSQEIASGVTLVFDPSVSPHYKVVCLNIYFISWEGRIKIYSSETDKWTTSTCRYGYYYNTLKDSGIYWNGSIHWIKYDNSSFYSYEYEIEKDIYKRVDMPKCPQFIPDKTLRYFGESKGYLHLVYIQEYAAKKFRVLERDRETLKWSVKYRVHICHLLSKFPEIRVVQSNDTVQYVFLILSVYKGEKEEDSALILTIPGKVVSYNFHSKMVKVLSELPSHDFIHTSGYDLPVRWTLAFNFIETLALV